MRGMNTQGYVANVYWVEINGETKGPLSEQGLRRLRGFTLQTPIRRSPQGPALPAFQVIDLQAYFATPVRGPAVSAKFQNQHAPLMERMFQGPVSSTPRRAGALVRSAQILTLLATAAVLAMVQVVPLSEMKQDALRASNAIVSYARNPTVTTTLRHWQEMAQARLKALSTTALKLKR